MNTQKVEKVDISLELAASLDKIDAVLDVVFEHLQASGEKSLAVLALAGAEELGKVRALTELRE